jgi:hypothetical protein
MSWTLSANGHAEDPEVEAALLRDLKDIFARYHLIVNDLQVTGQTGTLTIDAIKPQDNVVDFGATAGAEVPSEAPAPPPAETTPSVKAEPTAPEASVGDAPTE